MIVDCPGCAPDGGKTQEPSRARVRLPWFALVPAIFYALVPKCPMCLIAYLSTFGVTFGIASFVPYVLGPLSVGLVVLVLGFTIWRARVSILRDRARLRTSHSGRLVGRRRI
jgi:hypothetical protein